jgi:hypothetical protein
VDRGAKCGTPTSTSNSEHPSSRRHERTMHLRHHAVPVAGSISPAGMPNAKTGTPRSTVRAPGATRATRIPTRSSPGRRTC